MKSCIASRPIRRTLLFGHLRNMRNPTPWLNLSNAVFPAGRLTRTCLAIQIPEDPKDIIELKRVQGSLPYLRGRPAHDVYPYMTPRHIRSFIPRSFHSGYPALHRTGKIHLKTTHRSSVQLILTPPNQRYAALEVGHQILRQVIRPGLTTSTCLVGKQLRSNTSVTKRWCMPL